MKYATAFPGSGYDTWEVAGFSPSMKPSTYRSASPPLLNVSVHTNKTKETIVFIGMNQIFDQVAPALADLDLLTDDDLARAHELHRQASEYQAVARNSESVVAAKVADAADKLTGDPKLTADKLVATATNIPDPVVVAKLADHIEKSLTRQARSLILARADEAAGRINARLADISDQTATTADALAGVVDAQAAINAGKVTEWQTVNDLMAEYAALVRLVSALRELKVIPAPTGATSGPWWRFLRPEDTTSWLPAGATDWQKFVRDQAKKPWCATSVDEVVAVRDEQLAGVPA